eukprot:3205278-Rhodomonas_salina.1
MTPCFLVTPELSAGSTKSQRAASSVGQGALQLLSSLQCIYCPWYSRGWAHAGPAPAQPLQVTRSQSEPERSDSDSSHTKQYHDDHDPSPCLRLPACSHGEPVSRGRRLGSDINSGIMICHDSVRVIEPEPELSLSGGSQLGVRRVSAESVLVSTEVN